MENASKALIIAGAILISILLISLGILMFNASKGTTDQASSTGNALSNYANQGVEKIEGTLANTINMK